MGSGICQYPGMDIWDYLEQLAPNNPRWKWRVNHWRLKWERSQSDLRGKKQQVGYRHKFCVRCNALMNREEKRCPHCGARAGSWVLQTVGRAWQAFLPNALPATTLLLWGNGIVMGICLLLFGVSQLWQPSTVMLVRMGALIPELVLDGERWLLLTYGYLHIGILHILFNCWALSQLGPVIEREIGSARFFVIYTLAIVGGGAANVWVLPMRGIVLAGASGAIFGLIGFGISYPHFSGRMGGSMARGFFAQWALYGFVFGWLVPHISNTAHGGGFVVGLLMGYLLSLESGRETSFHTIWRALAIVSVLVTILSFLIQAGKIVLSFSG